MKKINEAEGKILVHKSHLFTPAQILVSAEKNTNK